MTSGSGSGAAAEQEDHEQDGDGHTQRPEQDVAHLPFLLATPLLKLFHASLQKVDAYRQQSPCLRGVWGFPLQGLCTRVRLEESTTHEQRFTARRAGQR